MTDPAKLKPIEDLLVAAGKAHHEAYAATDGEDPEWAMWYANFLAEPLTEILGAQLTRSELVRCLLNADQEHQARASKRPWASFYAEHFVECFAPSATAKHDHLVLYHYEMCPFCVMVRRVIGELGLEIELRNIWDDPSHRQALVAARGRATVPVLRIISPDGGDRWMPESRDIMRYLRQTYG